MTIVRSVHQPPSQQPKEWMEILTADPARPKNLFIMEASATWVTLFTAGLLFTLSTIVIQPFFLLFYSTRYPNLATASFTSVTLSAGALSLVTLAYIISILRQYLKRSDKVLQIIANGFVIFIAGWFSFLLFREAILWLINLDGVERVILGIQDLIQSIVSFI